MYETTFFQRVLIRSNVLSPHILGEVIQNLKKTKRITFSVDKKKQHNP